MQAQIYAPLYAPDAYMNCEDYVYVYRVCNEI